MKIIDTRGEICPKPIIMTKKQLSDIRVNEAFQILSDNETSMNNLLRFLNDNHFEAEVMHTEGYYTINCTKKAIELLQPESGIYCKIPEKNDYIIVFKSDKMGIGEDELGSILIKGFTNTITELETKPKVMIFYNSGVLLTIKSSPLAESLIKLQNEGVKIMVCGTCADYFHVKSEIELGTISNMYAICECLNSYQHIIYP